MIPENTSDRDSMIHLMGAMSDSPGKYIEDMEAAGQQQLVNSDRLPTNGSEDPSLIALGFTFGDPDPRDPMFRRATLPAGWKREGSDHSMWSFLVDEHGRKRVSIFYKAAFYDRSAHMSQQTVRSYAYLVLNTDGEVPIFDDQWCTPALFADALAGMREECAGRVQMYEKATVSWAAEELATCTADLAKIDALISKYPGR